MVLSGQTGFTWVSKEKGCSPPLASKSSVLSISDSWSPPLSARPRSPQSLHSAGPPVRITSHLWILHYVFSSKSASKPGTSSAHSLFLNLYGAFCPKCHWTELVQIVCIVCEERLSILNIIAKGVASQEWQSFHNEYSQYIFYYYFNTNISTVLFQLGFLTRFLCYSKHLASHFSTLPTKYLPCRLE